MKTDGSVVTWGGGQGANSSSVSSSLSSGVIQIVGNWGAFAALKTDGSVVTWGDSYAGGDSSSVSAHLTNGVIRLHTSDNIATYGQYNESFVALKDDGTLIWWGNTNDPGEVEFTESNYY